MSCRWVIRWGTELGQKTRTWFFTSKSLILFWCAMQESNLRPLAPENKKTIFTYLHQFASINIFQTVSIFSFSLTHTKNHLFSPSVLGIVLGRFSWRSPLATWLPSLSFPQFLPNFCPTSGLFSQMKTKRWSHAVTRKNQD